MRDCAIRRIGVVIIVLVAIRTPVIVRIVIPRIETKSHLPSIGQAVPIRIPPERVRATATVRELLAQQGRRCILPGIVLQIVRQPVTDPTGIRIVDEVVITASLVSRIDMGPTWMEAAIDHQNRRIIPGCFVELMKAAGTQPERYGATITFHHYEVFIAVVVQVRHLDP